MSKSSACHVDPFSGALVSCERRDAIQQKMQWVFENGNPDLLPTRGDPVEMTLGLDLTSIRDVDTASGEVEITVMRSMSWNNPYLAWNRRGSRIRNYNPISVDIKHLWTPDIVSYSAVHAPELLSPPLASVAADGTITYIPSERIRFRCDLEGIETTEGANCTLVFGSWTYHGGMMSLSGNPVSTNDLHEHPSFDLRQTYTEVETKQYPCCPEMYPNVRFTLNIRSKSSGTGIFGWKK